MKPRIQNLILLLALFAGLNRAAAQGTAFTYQGQLMESGAPANGLYDIRGGLYAADKGGTLMTALYTNTAVAVSNGMFTITMDFGSDVFDGTPYWLQIGVRPSGIGASFTPLSPRQELTPAPYAIYAETSSNLSGGNLSLPAATATSGIIYSGPVTLVSSYGVQNFFAGPGAGNLTLTGSANTGIGFQALFSVTGGYNNTASGAGALQSDTSGNFNTASGAFALSANGTGDYNTANGAEALSYNTTGTYNTAIGIDALYANTNGYYNTANGADALFSNTSGYENTANGTGALFSNTSGYENTANGTDALYSTTNGYENTANGYQALFFNTSGNENTATGFGALAFSTNGSDNTADGWSALGSLKSGSDNTGDGNGALGNTIGGGNTAVGSEAFAGYFDIGKAMNNNTAIGANSLPYLQTGDNNTAVGWNSLNGLTSGNKNIALGYLAGQNVSAGTNNIEIGNAGDDSDNSTIRIGTEGTQTNTFIAGIHSATAASGVAVYVNSSGQLGTLTSSRRYKDHIQGMDQASDVLYALKPVTFKYKPGIDPQGIPQFGLVAEDVEKVAPDLVAYDDQGKIFTVRYQAVDAMLLNEFLKEHRAVQNQNVVIETLKQQNDSLAERLNELEATVKQLATQK
jgi:hypothetical protein